MPRFSSLPPLSSEITDAVYCHLESKIGPNRQLRVACAGKEFCRTDYRVERDGYVCYGLELVVQGKGELRMAQKTFRLLPGHLFLYGPGVPHVIRCDPETPMVKYFADFFGGAPREIFSSGVIGPGEVRRTPELESMARLFDELLREGKKATSIRREVCAEYMKLLLLKSTEAGPATTAAYSQSLENLNRCRSYIDEHAVSLAGLEALAETVHLDPRYICRLFKRDRLPSPHRYIVSRRMNRAAELLVTTSLPVKSVAARSGYDDALHFSRAFSQYFQCSPTEFRKQRITRGRLLKPLRVRSNAS